MKTLPSVQVIPEFIAFEGGLDTTTPALRIPPGFVRDSQNFECDVNGGYGRVLGYERYDGSTEPSSVTYSILHCDNLDGSPVVAVGDTVTDNATTSTAVVLSVGTTGADGSVDLVVTRVVGAWPSGSLKVGGVIAGSFTDAPVSDGASTASLDAQYRNLAADNYRADICKAGENIVTITNASPAVVSWTAHGLEVDERVEFATTGALPTGITAGTDYYVLSAGLATDSFRISATSGGAAINTSSAGSGVHTCSAGSGKVRGVHVYGDVVYAFRDDLTGTKGLMWKSSSTGWRKVYLGRQVSFTNGAGSIDDGDTLTETTGGETAVIARVVIETGDLDSGTAAGRLILTGAPTGSEFDGGASTTTGGGTLTTSGASTAISIANPAGRYEFENFNFGQALRMYGVDGVNKGFEFDGTVFVPITSGMEATAYPYPSHMTIHKLQLFYSFGPNFQHSAPGEPYSFNAVIGASALNLGDTVTGFMPQAGGSGEGALSILGDDLTATLYGSGVDDWNLVPYKNGAGAKAYTIQRVTDTIMLDDRGLNTLTATQNYGNFADATISKRIQNWLATRRSLVRCSCVARDKNQYRLFFSDGSALYATFDNGKLIGLMPQLLSHIPNVAAADELSDGSEMILIGCDDGYVYRMERGTSFDGEEIDFFLYFVFNHSGSPNSIKRYRSGMFELSGDGYFEFSLGYELGYGSELIEQSGTVTHAQSLQAAQWDVAFWDNFTFDGRSLLPAEVDITGDAENISIVLSGSSDYFAACRFTGLILRYTPRRQLR
jgi:hypothetical protein